MCRLVEIYTLVAAMLYGNLWNPLMVGEVASLVLMDLSAAFDTVGHDILSVVGCRQPVGMSGPVIGWFRSYLQIVDVVFGQADLWSSAGVPGPISDVHCRLWWL